MFENTTLRLSRKMFHACNEKIYFQSQMSFGEINYGFMRQKRKKRGFISR